VTKLATTNVTIAWHHFQSICLQVGSKIQEAYRIFQDFWEKYPATFMILNEKGQCLMHMGKFEQTQGLFLESLYKVSSIHFSYRNLGSKIFGHQSSPSLCASHTK
jgi:hypothetical protein